MIKENLKNMSAKSVQYLLSIQIIAFSAELLSAQSAKNIDNIVLCVDNNCRLVSFHL